MYGEYVRVCAYARASWSSSAPPKNKGSFMYRPNAEGPEGHAGAAKQPLKTLEPVRTCTPTYVHYHPPF